MFSLILILDQKNGMSFYGRRQSRDSELCLNIKELTTKLYLGEKEQRLFELCGVDHQNIDFEECDYVLSEFNDYADKLEDISEIIVYRWDKVYPSNQKLGYSLEDKFRMVSMYEFEGKSHDKIIRERWVR